MRTAAVRIALGSLVAVTLALPAAGQDTASPHAAGARNAVTGHVRTPDGKPVAGVVVTLVARGTGVPGAPLFHPALDIRLHITTDDQGAYSLLNLPLGDYFVVAIPHPPVLVDDG